MAARRFAMPTSTDPQPYDRALRTLHWLMAALIVAAIILGFIAAKIGANETDPALKALRENILFWHKSFGLTILALGAVRIAWALTNGRPPLPAHLPKSERVLAKIVHASLYVLMIAMPVTGIVLSQAVGFPVSWFGLVSLPDFIHPDLSVPVMARGSVLIAFILHEKIFAYGLLGLLALHVAGLLKHHWIDRDPSIWRRMVPRRAPAPTVAEEEPPGEPADQV
jgi:cytochrome b561